MTAGSLKLLIFLPTSIICTPTNTIPLPFILNLCFSYFFFSSSFLYLTSFFSSFSFYPFLLTPLSYPLYLSHLSLLHFLFLFNYTSCYTLNCLYIGFFSSSYITSLLLFIYSILILFFFLTLYCSPLPLSIILHFSFSFFYFTFLASLSYTLHFSSSSTYPTHFHSSHTLHPSFSSITFFYLIHYLSHLPLSLELHFYTSLSSILHFSSFFSFFSYFSFLLLLFITFLSFLYFSFPLPFL